MGDCVICNKIGHLVVNSCELGNSTILKADKRDDLPLDVSPMTQIIGRFIYLRMCVVDVNSFKKSRKTALPGSTTGRVSSIAFTSASCASADMCV